MKATIITIVLAAVQFVTAQAQEFKPLADPKQPIVAPWGSSRLEVMQAAKRQGLRFVDMQDNEKKTVTHLTYLDGDTARLFTFYSDKYVILTHMYFQRSDVKRSEFTTTQVNYYSDLASTIDDESSFVIVLDNGEKVSVRVDNNDKSVAVRFQNKTLSDATLREQIRSGR
jgi:hypothetical protein